MLQIHHRVWVAVLVCASECPVREAVAFHSRAHLLGGKDLTPAPALFLFGGRPVAALQVPSNYPVSHCTPLGNFIPALKCPLHPTSCVVFCLLWLFLKTNFTLPTLPKTMVSESGEKFISRESNPLGSPKLPTFLQEGNHLPRTMLPVCAMWSPSEVCCTLGIAACALA